jgi:hypothetical protein
MTNYELLIKDIAERITGTKEDTSLRARLRDAKVDRLDSSTDIGVFLRDDALTRARLRPYATGGVIERPLPLL